MASAIAQSVWHYHTAQQFANPTSSRVELGSNLYTLETTARNKESRAISLTIRSFTNFQHRGITHRKNSTPVKYALRRKLIVLERATAARQSRNFQRCWIEGIAKALGLSRPSQSRAMQIAEFRNSRWYETRTRGKTASRSRHKRGKTSGGGRMRSDEIVPRGWSPDRVTLNYRTHNRADTALAPSASRASIAAERVARI